MTTNREPYDRLDPARFGLRLAVVVLAAAAAVLAVTGIGFRFESRDMTRRYIKRLNLSTPSLFPTGHVQRDVSFRHPAVDLRHGPQLPRTGALSHESLPCGSAALQRKELP